MLKNLRSKTENIFFQHCVSLQLCIIIIGEGVLGWKIVFLVKIAIINFNF